MHWNNNFSLSASSRLVVHASSVFRVNVEAFALQIEVDLIEKVLK